VLVVAAFDAAFASQTPECFAQVLLVEQLHARCVVAGEGFVFGRGGQGDLPTLTDLGRRLGFSTTAVQRVTLDGEIVSSSRVRELIAAGDIERATAFLGHYYTIAGRVVTGDRRGRAVVGIPTANLCVGEGKLLPPNGVYAVWAHLEGDAAPSPAVVNIGVRPTFAAAGQRHVAQAPPPVNRSDTPGGGCATMPCVEAHLLDADAATDLYDRQLTLEVVSRLRDERAFENPQALAQQIQKDIARARRILSRE
jgi:riboflavin kinase/FMN adenylyltransferase